MERTGFVKEKKGDTLSVCFERPEACEGCRGCSKGLLPKKELLTVFGKAEIGDEVVVRMPEAKTLKASLLAYGAPLCGAVAGLLIASAAGAGDGITLVAAIAGMAVGYGAVRLFDVRLRKNDDWRPTVVAVVSQKEKKE
ncbi:MAG: SoxR reducing system RseC family protein [Clostridia bacterium]|nr:SoxR reducing system RseC family protein [Clostridia bacterium]